MQGASFESARDEMGRDHAARTLVSHAGWDPAYVITRDWAIRLAMLLNLA
jgi:hypothetical protein